MPVLFSFRIPPISQTQTDLQLLRIPILWSYDGKQRDRDRRERREAQKKKKNPVIIYDVQNNASVKFGFLSFWNFEFVLY